MRHLMRIATCVVVTLFFMASFAQDDVASKKKEINSIKKNSSYIYGEATLADRQAAIDLAKDILYQNINQWVESQKKFAGASKAVTTNTNYAVENVTLPRGNWYRAFMYVKKSDIIPVDNVQVTDVSGSTSTRDGVSIVSMSQGSGLANGLTQEFLKPQNTGQLSAMLKRLKEQGVILEYNKLGMLEKPEQYVLFVFSREGNVLAVLSAGSSRKNLKTGKPDSLENYKGNGAIGVRVNTNR